ncbi:MAG: M1 family metallopeptidase [Fimbriimonas sp.]
MLSLALLLIQTGPSVSQLEELVKGKDVAGLTRLIGNLPAGVANPFTVIRTRGAYDTGRFGWTVEPLRKDYVVITTPLTSEDVGDILLKREGSALRYIPETDAMGITLHRHELDVRFNTVEKKATLIDKMSFTSEAGTGPFVFRMSPAYKVSSILNGTSKVDFSQAGGVVLAARPKGKATYTIRYSAVVDLPQYAGSVSTKEASLVNDYWYPMVARQPVPYDIAVHTQKDWVVVGQGELVSANETADEKVTRYRMDLPVIYYSVSAAPYKTSEKTINGKRYWMKSIRVAEDRMALQAELYAPIVEFYEKSFGKFPFSGYGALDSEVYGGGALEAYSYATYGGGMPGEDAHEPSHTWWGGILNNTYLGSFWNESFAVYSDGLFHRNAPIGSVADRRLAFIQVANGQQGFEPFPIEGGGAFIGPNASSLGYGKGALVLQMLEQILGTERMIKLMAAWVEADRGKAVDWVDFERVAYRLYPGENLKGFFDDWLRKPGFARLSVRDVRFEGGKVEFSTAFEGQPYRMPLEVMLEYPGGKRSFATVHVSGNGTYSVASSDKPALVSIDPWLRALRSIDANEFPDDLQRTTGRFKRYTDPAHKDWLANLGRANLEELPDDLNGVFVVGHPNTTPRMAELCRKAGFQVSGNRLTYRGVDIDLENGSALALVELAGGGRCGIGLGKTLLRPNPGRARVAVTDRLGRFLAGQTEPKTQGDLTYRL